MNKYISNNQTNNLGLAGGTALNRELNSQIMQIDIVDQIFIQSVAYDAGSVLEAGLHSIPEPDNESFNIYSGPTYSNDHIKRRHSC